MGTPRVLIVDDEPLIRWSLRESLEQAGFEVLEAGTADEARRLLSRGVVLVLLDLKLPDTGGLAFLKEIKREWPEATVILMTAYGAPETVRAALLSGAYRVVDKPFDLHGMTRLVEDALRKSLSGGPGSAGR